MLYPPWRCGVDMCSLESTEGLGLINHTHTSLELGGLWAHKSYVGVGEGSNEIASKNVKTGNEQDLPGGPVVKTPSYQIRGPRFNPWSGS